MAVTPTGILAKPLLGLRDLLSRTAQWKTLTGEATAAAAANHIYVAGLDLDDGDTWDDVRPLMVIAFEDPGWSRQRNAETDWIDEWTLLVSIEITVPEAYRDDPAEALTDLLNKVGAVWSEAWAIQGADDDGTAQIVLRSTSMVAHELSNEDEVNDRGHYAVAVFTAITGTL